MNAKIVGVALFVILAVSWNVSAETETVGDIAITPDFSSVSIPAGSQGVVSLTIDVINSDPFSYRLTVVSGMADGNLPLAWVSSSPVKGFLSPGFPLAATLTISVPHGTPSGIYSGHLVSSAVSSHGSASPGVGFLISVTVPADCSGVAEFHLTSPDPLVLWPPSHGMETVAISGTVDIPAGCSLLEAGYIIDDEYGIYTSVGNLVISNDRNFALTIPVEAWREGQDRDGRHYAITLFARDDAGTGSSTTTSIIVPHDQRQKPQLCQ